MSQGFQSLCDYIAISGNIVYTRAIVVDIVAWPRPRKREDY